MANKRDPWGTGPITCDHCKHEWTGVFPLPIIDGIRCPECHRIMGWPNWGFDTSDNLRWVCPCGGATYRLLGRGTVLCCHCGREDERPPLA